jgi:hypothetical protein
VNWIDGLCCFGCSSCSSCNVLYAQHGGSSTCISGRWLSASYSCIEHIYPSFHASHHCRDGRARTKGCALADRPPAGPG